MIVICIEGCHGSGKTQLCEQFEEAGYTVLDEAFLDMPDYALHPQTLLMETKWVCSWFERLLKFQQTNKKKGLPEQVLIADRSPYSAVFYANNGHLLEPIIRHQIEEVQAGANIEIHTVLVSVEKELLWSRIQQRLCNEPERLKYNEGERGWMEKVCNFYQTMTWDLTVENNEIDIRQVKDAVVTSVASRSTGFQNIYKRLRSESGETWDLDLTPSTGTSAPSNGQTGTEGGSGGGRCGGVDGGGMDIDADTGLDLEEPAPELSPPNPKREKLDNGLDPILDTNNSCGKGRSMGCVEVTPLPAPLPTPSQKGREKKEKGQEVQAVVKRTAQLSLTEMKLGGLGGGGRKMDMASSSNRKMVFSTPSRQVMKKGDSYGVEGGGCTTQQRLVLIENSPGAANLAGMR